MRVFICLSVIKILDGNHLAATERRLAVLQDCAAGPLPGLALVVLEPESGLVTQMVGCEDGHAQERSMVDAVIAAVQPQDVFITDRNFCTARMLNGVADQDGFFFAFAVALVASNIFAVVQAVLRGAP